MSAIQKWFRDGGDHTHNITYDLNENSVVMDLGGYTGRWAQQMINKYNPNMYILEPIGEFYNVMVDKFRSNNKVRLMNVGASTENKTDELFMSDDPLEGDGTSSTLKDGKSVEVQFYNIETILNKWNLNIVDLIQINIEGDEYPLLEDMLKTGVINKFKNIQIQFHLGINGDKERRDKIREGLENNGFKEKFNYPFVWESWYKL
jgi:FkbM family methyltransferase